MEKSLKERQKKALEFARLMDANKQKHKKHLQEEMQKPEFLKSIESLKHAHAL